MPNSHSKHRLIAAWEITRRCSLQCRHCRGAARDCDYEDELSTAECLRVIDSLVEFGPSMIILTGGEPLVRGDIFDVAQYADQRGCRVVMATCGHMLNLETAARLKACNVMAISVSLDSPDPGKHDDFRGVPGAFGKTLTGLHCLKRVGIPFQINTTVSKLNVDRLPDMLGLAVELGAAAIDFFFLVPTGRGSEIAELELDAEKRDEALQWIAGQAQTAPIGVRTTCAPQYKRFVREGPESTGRFRGCMGGRGFIFISHTGRLQPCGFLEVEGGDLRGADFDFAGLYREAEVFKNMRKLNPFAGCPARAYARTGDYMKEEP